MQKLPAGKFHFAPPSRFTLFDHLVGAREQGRRDFKAEGSGRLEIDGQFEFGRLLDRKVSRTGALEYPVDVGGSATKQVEAVRRIGHEPTGLHMFEIAMHWSADGSRSRGPRAVLG